MINFHIAWVRTRPAVLVQHTVSKPAVATCSNAMLIWKGLLSSSVAFTFVFVQIEKAPNIAALTNTMLIHRNCLRFQYHLDFSPDMSLLWYVVKSLLSLLTKTRFSNYMWWGRSILWHHSCAIGKTFGAILKLERKGFQGAKIFPSLYFSKGLKFFEESERKLFYLIYFQSDPCTIWETFFCQQLWQVWS